MSMHAHGMRAWLLQRLTAVYIALYIFIFASLIVSHYPVDFDNWLALFKHPVVLITTIIFYLSIFIHAWVGVRDILVDYVKPTSVRFLFLTALALFLTIMTSWLLLLVIRLVKI